MTQVPEGRVGLNEEVLNVDESQIRTFLPVNASVYPAQLVNPLLSLAEGDPHQIAPPFPSSPRQGNHRPKGHQVAGDVVQRLRWHMLRGITSRLFMDHALTDWETKPPEPVKHARNSSVPPSKTPKEHTPARQPRGICREASVGRAGGGRSLHPDPAQVIAAKPKSCPHYSRGLYSAICYNAESVGE